MIRRLLLLQLLLLPWILSCSPSRHPDFSGYAFFVDNQGGAPVQLTTRNWKLEVPADSIRTAALPLPERAEDTEVFLNGKLLATLYTAAQSLSATVQGQDLETYQSLVVDPSGLKCYTARVIEYEPVGSSAGRLQPRFKEMNLEGQQVYFVPRIDYFLEEPPQKLNLYGVKVAMTTWRYSVQASGCPPPPTAWERLNEMGRKMSEDRMKDILK